MFRTIVHIVLVLALSVLVGAILFFGAGVASVLFQPGLLPSRTLAGAVNGVVLHRLNVIAGACAAIMAVALGYLAFTSPRGADRISFGFGIAVLIVVLYLGLKLLPEVNALRLEIGDFDHLLPTKEPLREQFQELHTLYSRLMQGVLFASVGILVAQIARLALGFIRGSRVGAEQKNGRSGEGREGGRGEREVEKSGEKAAAPTGSENPGAS